MWSIQLFDGLFSLCTCSKYSSITSSGVYNFWCIAFENFFVFRTVWNVLWWKEPGIAIDLLSRVLYFLSECITVDGPTPDGVPDRKRYGSMKLLQFHENYRPAYWGTWSKKSSHISPRCPLRQDKVRTGSHVLTLAGNSGCVAVRLTAVLCRLRIC